jgi:hypothetical protein
MIGQSDRYIPVATKPNSLAMAQAVNCQTTRHGGRIRTQASPRKFVVDEIVLMHILL